MSDVTPTVEHVLIDRLVPEAGGRIARLGRTLALAGVGALFLAILAQLRLEIGPVPITGQTLGVLLLAAAYGPRRSLATLAVYITLGAAGLGVFSGGGAGVGTLTGTTAGYIAGFLPAAYLVGALARKGWDRSVRSTLAAMALGNLLIYAFGVVWLLSFAPAGSVPLLWAVSTGILPFLPGDILKAAGAATLLPAVRRYVDGCTR